MFSNDKLKEKREQLGYSQAYMADKLGISRVSYFTWESGKTQPNQKNLSKLADLLSVSDSFFESQHDIVDVYLQLDKGNQRKSLDYSKELLQEQQVSSTVKETLYSYKVFERLSAGTGFSYFGDGNYDEVFYHEKLDHDFASWVFGDSMEPTYLNGEVVLIKQNGFDYDGAVYAVEWDGQTYIKKVYREENGLRLVSINHKYTDKFAPFEEEPRIIGKIIGNFRPMEA